MHEVSPDGRLALGTVAVPQPVDLRKNLQRTLVCGDHPDNLLGAQSVSAVLKDPCTVFSADRTRSRRSSNAISGPEWNSVNPVSVRKFAPFKNGPTDHANCA